MIELLNEFSGNVVGIKASGSITERDYDDVVIPALDAALQNHNKIRVYYELPPVLDGVEWGAAWKDTVTGVKNYLRWEKFAVVTDTDWIRHSVNFFGFFMLCPVKVFSTEEKAAAKAWIAA